MHVLYESTYEYHVNPDIISVIPSFISSPNDYVTIIGKGFCLDRLLLKAGASIVPSQQVFFISSTILTVQLPYVVDDSQVFDLVLAISVNDGVDYGKEQGVRILPDLKIKDLNPRIVVSSSRRQSVTVVGSGFVLDQILQCCYGLNFVTNAWLSSSNQLICPVPNLPVGSFQFRIRRGNLNSRETFLFQYVARSHGLIHPSTGPTSGGIKVQLSVDTDLVPLTCSFQSIGITHVRDENGSYFCILPLSNLDQTLVPLIVSTKETEIFRTSFLYYKMGILQQIKPSVAYGNNILFTIYGINFDENLRLYFSSNKFRLKFHSQFLSSSEIRAFSASEIYGNFTVHVDHDDDKYASNSLSVKIRQFVKILSVKPSTLHTMLETTITIIGDRFRHSRNFHCRLGKDSNFQALIVTSTVMLCNILSNRVDFRSLIILDESTVCSYPMYLHFGAYSQIKAVIPSSGPMFGGTEVTVIGSNLEGNAACIFGGNLAKYTSVTSSKLVCWTPAHESSELVEVCVGSILECNGARAKQSSYRYFDESFLLEALPSRSVLQGGTLITIFGHRLSSNDLVMKLGDFIVPRQNIDFRSSNHLLILSTKQWVPGYYTLLSSNNNGNDFHKSSLTLEYLQLPVLKEVIPSVGLQLKEHKVTIIGQFFNFDTIEILFGQTKLCCDVANSSTAMCLMPAKNAGRNVIAARYLGQLAKESLMYDILDTFEILSMTVFERKSLKLRIIMKLNVEVELSDILCTVQGEPMKIQLASRSSVFCEIPNPHTQEIPITLCIAFTCKTGRLFLQNITANSGDFLENTSLLQHLEPRILTVSPSTIVCLANTMEKIEIAGVNFHLAQSISCHLADKTEETLVLTSSFIICEVHCQQPKKAILSIEMQTYETKLQENFNVTLNMLSTIRSIIPSIGPENGGTVVTLEVTAEIMSPPDGLGCMFGETIGSEAQVSGSVLRCIAPKALVPGLVNVSLIDRSEGLELARGAVPYQYFVSPHVQSISPRFGRRSGGTLVYIAGTGFHLKGLSCRFGNQTVDGDLVRAVTSSLVECVSPAADEVGKSTVEVSFNGLDYTADE
eukprot:763827-Hanusia_phi.AAC.2